MPRGRSPTSSAACAVCAIFHYAHWSPRQRHRVDGATFVAVSCRGALSLRFLSGYLPLSVSWWRHMAGGRRYGKSARCRHSAPAGRRGGELRQYRRRTLLSVVAYAGSTIDGPGARCRWAVGAAGACHRCTAKIATPSTIVYPWDSATARSKAARTMTTSTFAGSTTRGRNFTGGSELSCAAARRSRAHARRP